MACNIDEKISKLESKIVEHIKSDRTLVAKYNKAFSSNGISGFRIRKILLDNKDELKNSFMNRTTMSELSDSNPELKKAFSVLQSVPSKDTIDTSDAKKEKTEQTLSSPSSKLTEELDLNVVSEGVLVAKKWWTRGNAIDNNDALFIFGENDEETSGSNKIEGSHRKYPNSTQAVVRGLENAIGIYTKKNGKDGTGYYSDSDYDGFMIKLEKKIKLIKEKSDMHVIFPSDGFGTGKAQLKVKAPKLYYAMNKRLNEEFGLAYEVNTTASTQEDNNKPINIWSSENNGYEKLSNFAFTPFEYGIYTFQSVEVAYQLEKPRYASGGKKITPELEKWHDRILFADSAAIAKQIGGERGHGTYWVKQFNNERYETMKGILEHKFKDNKDLAELLMSTGTTLLTHVNPENKRGDYWTNNFPKVLMEVRAELIKKYVPEKAISTSLINGTDVRVHTMHKEDMTDKNGNDRLAYYKLSENAIYVVDKLDMKMFKSYMINAKKDGNIKGKVNEKIVELYGSGLIELIEKRLIGTNKDSKSTVLTNFIMNHELTHNEQSRRVSGSENNLVDVKYSDMTEDQKIKIELESDIKGLEKIGIKLSKEKRMMHAFDIARAVTNAKSGTIDTNNTSQYDKMKEKLKTILNKKCK